MTCASRVDAIATLEAGYDLRVGVEELRLVWHPGLRAMVYRYTVNGRVAMQSHNTARIFNTFLIDRTAEDIEVVSPRYRARRFRPNTYIGEDMEPVEHEHEDTERFTSEPVSELLPEYRLNLKDYLSD